jgi:hypothetical protein
MKHAFLITAYRDFLSLESSIDQLLKIDESVIFITVDRKQKEFIKKIQENSDFLHNSRVQWRFDLKINWGSYDHVQAYLDMCKQALNHNADYYHSMTGQCKVIVRPEEFCKFFAENKYSYIEYFKLPRKGWDGKHGGLARMKYWQLYDLMDAKKYGKLFKRLNQYIVSIQKILGVSRLKKNNDYFGGSGYWSLQTSAILKILEITNLSKNKWRHTFCPEEFLYQTILKNSAVKESLINNSLRYVYWGEKHNETPGILDEVNLEEIRKSKFIFARKFDSSISKKLILLLNLNSSDR